MAYIGKTFLSLLIKTCKVRIEGLEHFKEAVSQEKCILMFWHNRIVLAAEILTRFAPEYLYTALISQSRDGEIIAAITHSYSIGSSIRVSHKGRKAALDETIRQVSEGDRILIITPDGPKGPAYKIKRGSAYIAKAAGAAIIPLSWSADKCWKLNTWDRLLIPKPFSTIEIFFGPAVKLEKAKMMPTQDEISEIESKLMAVTKDWA